MGLSPMLVWTPLPDSPTRGRRCLTSQTAVHSRRKRSGLTEEPGIEKVVQFPARNLLSHDHKVFGGHVTPGMAGHILTQSLEKRLVADFAAQRAIAPLAYTLPLKGEPGSGFAGGP